MTTTEHTSLVLRLYEKFDKGELDDFADAIDSHVVANVLGTTTPDWAGFRQFGNAFLSAFPDGRHVFDYVVADGENVVTIGTYQGTHRGEMQGIAPTNRQLKLPVMHLDRVTNGKIVEHRGLARTRWILCGSLALFWHQSRRGAKQLQEEPSMANQHLTEEVRGFCDAYNRAFASINGGRIAALYYVPTVTMRADGSIHCLQSREELARFFQNVADTHHREGYRDGRFQILEVILR
jgi:predicted ester cyclase